MQPRRIGFLAFDGMQALDLFGPADAFGSDAFAAADDEEFRKVRPYEIVVIGLQRRTVQTSVGTRLVADYTTSTHPASALELDTLIIPGGAGLRRPGVAEKAARWILEIEPPLRRIASVCTGIYALAQTGLLDHRRATTHWSAVTDVASRFPRVKLDPNAIYVRDGRFLTSAGVTAGIDMALALIEEDLGSEWALVVARELVVYLKRPGGQAQYSEPLRFQTESSDRFRNLASWVQRHLHRDLSVDTLAARCHVSPRQFARAFVQEFGVTPGAFVTETRLAEASRRLAAKRASVALVARSVGYSSDDVFRRAFEKRFGICPTTYRRRFGAGDHA